MLNIKFKKLIAVSVFVFGFFLLLCINSSKAFAADFDVDITYIYEVEKDGSGIITQKFIYTNNTQSYYIPADAEQSFIIYPLKPKSAKVDDEMKYQKDNISLTDENGNPYTFSSSLKDNVISVSTSFERKVSRGSTHTFILKYKSHEVAEKVGNIWNIFVPGFSEQVGGIQELQGVTVSSKYVVELIYHDDLGRSNFILPEPASKKFEDGKEHIVFASDDLINNGVWVQLGREQYYSFSMHQRITKPENNYLKNIFVTRYEIILPAKLGNQKVFYSTIDPEPLSVRLTGEGNMIAEFEFGNSDYKDIFIEGIIATEQGVIPDFESVGTVNSEVLDSIYLTKDDGSILKFKDLLDHEPYWEVNANEIQTKAKEIQSNIENPYELVKKDYQFVIENVNYDNLKLTLGNKRQGALATLKGGSSVCMEYSDLLITLLRAQGVPTRAAFGYTYDPKDDKNQANQQGHQWVEAYLPEIGWVSIDPTWGDSARREYIGPDIDHAYWYVAAENVDSPPQVSRISRGMDAGTLDSIDFEIKAISRIELSNYTTQEELLSKYNYQENPRIPIWSDMTTQGRQISTIILIVVVFILAYMLIGIVRVTVKSFRSPKTDLFG